MKPDVSVIVPIYNVAGYLEQCLDSLINQSHRNIEIICIDDGSTDKSGEIIDAYAAKDKRVKAIHQPNAGVSAARNKGLETARGEYISFVDGDDWIDTNAYQTILAEIGANRPDMVLFRHAEVFNDCAARPKSNKAKEKIGKEFDFKLMLGKYAGVVWDKLFRRDFINQHNIRFMSDVSLGEDGLFNVACYAAAPSPSIYQVDGCFYFYRQFRKGSTMDTAYGLEVCEKQRLACENAPFYATLPTERKMMVDAKICGDYIYRFNLLNDKDRQRNLAYMTNLRKIYEERYGQPKMVEVKFFAALNRLIKTGGRTHNSLAKRLFHIGNSRDKRYKIVRIFGLEVRFKRKPRTSDAQKAA